MSSASASFNSTRTDTKAKSAAQDDWLFLTHIIRVATSTLHSCYGTTWSAVLAGMSSRAAARIQWFTGVKAVLNTAMVLCGFKKPPSFKVTPKKVQGGGGAAGAAKADACASAAVGDGERGRGRQYRAHAAVSRVTEARKHVMPMDGTLDIWVLMAITALNIAAAAFGLVRIGEAGALAQFGGGPEGVLYLGIVFAIVDAVRDLYVSSLHTLWCVLLLQHCRMKLVK